LVWTSLKEEDEDEDENEDKDNNNDVDEDEDTHAHLMEKVTGEKSGAAIANMRNENAVAVAAVIVA
jgi:hypothetical protein